MSISGLMVSELDLFGIVSRKAKLQIYFSIFFEDSNEETIGREQKEEVLW